MENTYSSKKQKLKYLWEANEIQEWKISNKEKLSLDWNATNFNKKAGVYLIEIEPRSTTDTRLLVYETEITLYNFPDELVPFLKFNPVLPLGEAQVGTILSDISSDIEILQFYADIKKELDGTTTPKYTVDIWFKAGLMSVAMGVLSLNLYISLPNPHMYYEIRKNKK